MQNQCREPSLGQQAAAWVFAILLGVAIVAVAEMPTWLTIWRAIK